MKKTLALFLSIMMLMMTFSAYAADKLVVGTHAEFPPFEYIGDDGTIQGFDADLMTAIMEKVGQEIEITNMDFASLILALQNGQIDMAIAGMTITEERMQNVNFSDPYFEATQKLIVNEGSAIAASQDITAEMKIGVQEGTTGDMYATDNMPAKVERYNKALDAVLDLKNGRLDAVLVDAAPSEYLAANVGGVVVLEENISEEQYGIAMRKEDTQLLESVNAALKDLIDSGAYAEIYANYFGVIETEVK